MKKKMMIKFKSVYALLLSVVLSAALLLGGCMTSVQPRGGGAEGGGTSGETTVTEADRIAALERQLEALRAEQASRDEAYEARIRELERALSASDAPTAADGSELLFTYEENGQGLTLTGWNGTAKTLVIPQTIGGKAVTAIADGAFRNCELERVTVPDGVRAVGWFAFSGCYRLASVSLPASVESIGYGAFEHCSSALRFTCPSGSYAAKYAASYGIPTSAQ
ncbi:MAG TPA: hypothetical protein DDW30_07140 [Clostridiales bacterium]|nr:hypothetical protein [Clostridiales bacterium]